MDLENLAFDALDPLRLGGFWEALLGGSRLTTGPDIVETRLSVAGGPTLDLCFQQVPSAPDEAVRLHLDLLGGAAQSTIVSRALSLGAAPLDLGQGDVPWVVLADPEGNAFCVMDDRASYVDTGPIAAVPIDSGDPARDVAFWSWLTGWTVAGEATLRHPSGRGLLLQFCPEPRAKTEAKNRMHLDVRLEAGEDAGRVADGIAARGGRELHPGWGELPWRVYADPSGNEFCVLPAH